MGLINNISISTLTCLHPSQGLTICPVETITSEKEQGFDPPLFSHETTLVTLAPGTIEDLFVHHHQTDQLLVIRGNAVLIILLNKQYQYILMSEAEPRVIKIPPGVPHGAVNLSPNPCTAINSILFHGTPTEKDYRPIKPPFSYDLERVRKLLPD
ncbi:dTDP-4-dehydrorhamnose 3,5-epimerase [Aphanothece hegewaldii CCALA 016]|uniref:dTDP-4-dehydrorhamnose 3,5-epimerase n=1 Tax=Aphanothece hegewaldii CCALA 016 TaxID=2107694 RepID=A0A2T1M3R9_9CHRO|nr:dTDP-4-dehydrorhamnose 3,5-epimerase [Aphanothece hegewaldii]PSF39456.1 dTDP-4-dehydrorhamnose 3,5-epimerase [Aphanothece hegewaldii CCALA 016]